MLARNRTAVPALMKPRHNVANGRSSPAVPHIATIELIPVCEFSVA
jgi:hypothetical protein